MKHPAEQTIEKIVLAWRELGFSEEWDLGARIPVNLAPSLAHVRTCTHCREILETLVATEAARPAGAKEGWRDPTVLALRPYRTKAPLPRPTTTTEGESEELLVAAADASTRPAQSRVLTLVTDDDRYVVRIYPTEEGEGATAILVTVDAEAQPKDPGVRPVLRIGSNDFEFDEANITQLPLFPTSDVSLVLRGPG